MTDDRGGVVVTWIDARGDPSFPDIYAQRVNSNGTIQWTGNGIAVCAATNAQSIPQIVSDGGAGAIIAWLDYRNYSDPNIYGQRIDSNGTASWSVDGIAISTAASGQSYLKTATDANGGAIITWEDGRSDAADIYAQRINSNGTLSDFLIPSAPQNLTTIVGSTQVILRWSKNSEADFLRYRIYGGTLPNPTSKIDSTVGGINDTVKAVTGLTNGTTHYFRVTAVDSSGNESGYSNEVSVVPSKLTAQYEYNTDNNTVLLLHMNEIAGASVSDASGKGNNGTATGTSIVDGRFGKARGLPGTLNDYVSLPPGVTPTSGISIEMWVSPSAGGGTFFYWGPQNGCGPSSQTFWIGTDLRTGVSSGCADLEHILSVDSLVTGRWAHVALTIDPGGNGTLFINGREQNVPRGFQYSSVTGGNDVIGYQWVGGNRISPLSGTVDEVRISNIARAPQEFNLQLPPVSLSATPSATTINLIWQNCGGAVPLMQYKIYRGTDSTTQIAVDSTTATSYLDVGLSPLTDYFYRISAVDSSGFEGARSYAISATVVDEPPIAPQNLVATAGNGQVSLQWKENTEPDFLRYRIYGGISTNPTSKIDSTAGGINDTVKTITGLTNGSTYYLRITAVDSAGNESGYSNEENATPSVLTSLKEYNPDANTALLLHMNEATGDAVYDASEYGNDGSANGASIVVGRFALAREFNPNPTNQFVSIAYASSLDFDSSDGITLEAWIKPQFPQPNSSSGIISSLQNPDGTGYELRYEEYSSDTVGLSFLHMLNGNGTPISCLIAVDSAWRNSWHHAAITVNTLETLAQIHVDGIERARLVHPAFSSLPGSDPIYIGARISGTGEGLLGTIDEVRISNKYRSPQEFNLQLPPVNLSAIPSGTTINLNWQNGGGAVPLMRYKIYRGSDSTTQILIDSTTSTSHPNGGLSSGIYFYRVSAVDSTGFEGAKSYAASGTVVSPIPGVPQNLTAIAGNGQVTLRWNKNLDLDFLRYRIYSGTSPNPTARVDSTTGGVIDTTATITGLTNGTTYYFRVTAVDSAGNESGYSNEVSATPASPPTITSFAPSAGPIGTTVTITGTGFSPTANNNIVYFGATRANVNSASSASLSITVPVGATFAPISITDSATGLTAFSNSPFIVTFPGGGVIDSVSFAPRVNFTAGSIPRVVAISDLDADGKPDLSVTNSNSNTVSVFRNTSVSGSIAPGSFGVKVDFATGGKPRGIAVGDLDGDGKQDLVITNNDSATVSVFRNTSVVGSITSASVDARVDFASGTNPRGVAIGDFDQNGKPDLAVANAGSNTVSVFRNASVSGSITSESFAGKTDFITGSSPDGVAIGDLDGDGHPDLITANFQSNTISVFRNAAVSGPITSGSFDARQDFATGNNPYGVSIGDLDRDGKPDLVVTNWGSNTVSVFRNTSVGGSITAGSLSAKTDFTTGIIPYGVALGDLDGDGKLDFAVTNVNSNTVSLFRNTSVNGSITSGSFSPRIDYATGTVPDGVAIGDLDGDGRPELVVANEGSGNVSVFRNIGSPPIAPESLSAVGGNSQATLGWFRNAEPDFLRYRIYGGTSPNPTVKIDSTTGGISDTLKTITSLTNGTTYYFRVTAVDSAGNESGYSNEVSARPSVLTDQFEYNPDTSTALLLHMNETGGQATEDASSFQNDGAATGTVIVNGRFGKARSFNGSSDAITIASSPSLNVGASTDFTIEAWIRPLVSQTSYLATIVTKTTIPPDVQRGYQFELGGGLPAIEIAGTGTSGTTSLLDSKWHHVAAVVTRNDSTMRIFVDGKQEFSPTPPTNRSAITLDHDNTKALQLGIDRFASQFYSGLIDEVRLSKIARSPQGFNLQLPPTNLSINQLTTSSLTLNWQNGGGAVPLMRYKVYRGADSTTQILIDSTTSTSYPDAGLSPSTTYFYRITAVDSTGFEGAKSFAVSGTTL